MKTLIISLVIAVGVVLAAFFKSPIFIIRSQSYKIDQADCLGVEELKKDANLANVNLFLVNLDSLNKKLKSKYPCAKSVSLKKTGLNSVEIRVTGREGKLVLALYPIEATPSSASSVIESINLDSFDEDKISERFLVDDQNQVFAHVGNGGNLPEIISLGGNLKLGQNLGGNTVSNILNIIKRVKELSLDTRKVLLFNKSILIGDTDPKKLYFSLDSDIEKELASLQLILQKSKMNSDDSAGKPKPMESVDLRFDKPVVVYSPKK